MDRLSAISSDAIGCPKRIWVMLTLSDDEVVGRGGALPDGLRFHLTRCPSCRSLADDLLAVSEGLGSMASAEPPSTLHETALLQTRAALEQGARLTGRIDIPDDILLGEQLLLAPAWHRVLRYAAAASIVFAAGLGAMWSLGHNADPGSMGGPTTVNVTLPVDSAGPPQPGDDFPADAPAVVEAGTAGHAAQRTCHHESPLDAALCDKLHPNQPLLPLPQREVDPSSSRGSDEDH